MTGWNIMLIGGILIIVGALMLLFPHLKLPLLPGDILIRNKESTIYFPVLTSIVTSILATILINLFR